MNKSIFGAVGGKEVYLYHLVNDFMEVSITNYGAIVQSILVPDKDGLKRDVVMGYDNLKDYIDQKYYFGCIIGRCANRITNAAFKLNGITYYLEKNEGNNHLHGGSKGFWNQLWEVEDEKENAVTLSYISKDGEEGYPGEVKTKVKYTLTGQRLCIEYEATTDRDTIINLTNHSYFNLSGDFSKTIENHVVSIDADYFTEINEKCASTGKILPVEGTAFDLRNGVLIKERLFSTEQQMVYGMGFNHNFVLNNQNRGMRKVATAIDLQSSRQLNIWTDRPGLHFYTGNYLNGITGKKGDRYKQYGGFCFETQNYPDAINFRHFPSPILKAGEVFRSTTIFEFLNK